MIDPLDLLVEAHTADPRGGVPLSVEAQHALCVALREHVSRDTTLDDSLGLRLGGPGRNARTRLLADMRDRFLTAAWRSLAAEEPLPWLRTKLLHGVIGRRMHARDEPADSCETLVDMAVPFLRALSLPSVDRLHRIVTR